MRITRSKLEGPAIIQLEPKEDHRGFFMRVYDDQILSGFGLHRKWVQENHSLSRVEGTVRGFHFQFPPHAETKLVRVVSGEVFDVFLDLRKGSPTFGQWDHTILSAENKRMLYIPRGFAHGMCTLTRDTTMLYKVDNYYAPDHESAIRWDDPDLAVPWPRKEKYTLSDKDAKAGSFKEFLAKVGALEI